ncbi:hypothetical protein [Candidatus Amarolinea dominans]|nr:hypothetical protein [Anaerolineae bacterium]
MIEETVDGESGCCGLTSEVDGVRGAPSEVKLTPSRTCYYNGHPAG